MKEKPPAPHARAARSRCCVLFHRDVCMLSCCIFSCHATRCRWCVHTRSRAVCGVQGCLVVRHGMYVCMCASFCADFCAFVAPKHGVDDERIAVLAVANKSVTSSSWPRCVADVVNCVRLCRDCRYACDVSTPVASWVQSSVLLKSRTASDVSLPAASFPATNQRRMFGVVIAC